MGKRIRRNPSVRLASGVPTRADLRRRAMAARLRRIEIQMAELYRRTAARTFDVYEKHARLAWGLSMQQLDFAASAANVMSVVRFGAPPPSPSLKRALRAEHRAMFVAMLVAFTLGAIGGAMTVMGVFHVVP